MIAFPLIESVSVHGYTLCPDRHDSRGFDFDLGAGPWLILGVNGLGKSTLLLLLRYLLTGPVRTRSAGFAGEREDLQSVNIPFSPSECLTVLWARPPQYVFALVLPC